MSLSNAIDIPGLYIQTVVNIHERACLTLHLSWLFFFQRKFELNLQSSLLHTLSEFTINTK